MWDVKIFGVGFFFVLFFSVQAFSSAIFSHYSIEGEGNVACFQLNLHIINLIPFKNSDVWNFISLF